MAHLLKADTIDFAAYERATETEHKVRPAADFADDLEAEFMARESGKRAPSMTSTKARQFIEFRPGEVTAWAGFNGHRKSMFVSQLVLDLCQADERVLVASFEMTVGKTLARMAQQASGTARPDAYWRRAFTDWSRGRLWLFDHLGSTSPEMAMGLCRYFAHERRGSHVVIDSMMMVCASEESQDEQKQFVTGLCRVAQECGIHVHLVVHARKPQSGSEDRPPTKYDIRGSAAISDQCANVVTVWMDKAKARGLEANPHDQELLEKPDALVSIEKQRNGSWEGRMKLWFDPTSLRFCDDRMSAVQPYELMARGA
jgi:twinkle protein